VARMSKSRNTVDRHAFTKIIEQVEIQNRMKEEQDMWKQHKEQKLKKGKVKMRKRKRSLTCDSDEESLKSAKRPTVSSKDRWGHSGFVELYPNEIISGTCLQSDDSNSSTVKKMKKKKLKKKKNKKSKKHKRPYHS